MLLWQPTRVSTSAHPHWQLWIDTGGTFTDCIAISPGLEMKRLKILSSSVLRGKVSRCLEERSVVLELTWPVDKDIFQNFEFRSVDGTFKSKIESIDLASNVVHLSRAFPKSLVGASIEISSLEEVPVLAARLLTGTPIGSSFPALEMKLGSTRGTNAILERKGARTALLVTKGFRDLLIIGNQQRPDLFALQVIKPEQLYKFAIEVDERIESDGNILKAIGPDLIKSIAALLKSKKIDSVAIALLNSYKNPSHEMALMKGLKLFGFKYVSVSYALSSQIKILPRAETCVANAYLDPIIRKYLSGIQDGLSGARLSVMTSAGGLIRSDAFSPKDSLLSGPAGGVVGAARQARRSGLSKIIAFDMGGTSTDVSLYNGRFDYRFESRVGSFKILSPSLAIETIAAGGGSICDFDGHRFTVGPRSAGADPGPACYGAGGPLTITDVNLLLGRLDPETFAIPIDPSQSRRALLTLLEKIKKLTGRPGREEVVLESLVQIANEKMAEAIKKISVQEGYDPGEFVLLSFGGAGGQHACALANILDMKQVLAPYDAGLLSAYGIGHAAVERFEEKLILLPWKKFQADFKNSLQEIYERAHAALIRDGFSETEITWKKSLVFLRFQGQDSSLEIEYEEGSDILRAFRKKYISIFGHFVKREVEVESIKVIVSVEPPTERSSNKKIKSYRPLPEKTQWIVSGGEKQKGGVYRWEKLSPGAEVAGPALVISGNSTTFIEDCWKWSLDAKNNAHLVQQKKTRSSTGHSKEALLELFTNRFTALAHEMGALLQRTSFSVNVKERLDFSCALLDPQGYLVVNAPHIPVHLGSLGVCVREVSKVISMRQGDVIITNHPGLGGSHLPDVTLIKPVFFKKKLVGYVANRAHHAEIGGKKPGSMPADATTLEEEGVIISPTYLVRRGKPRWENIRKVLISGRYPTRALEENLADLNGALAAVNLGETGLMQLCDMHGLSDVGLHMKELRTYAASMLRDKIKSLKKKSFQAVEKLDDGSVLAVKIAKKKDRLRIDFTGSAKMHRGNLNATKAIVQSVVLYTLRILVDQPLPMNEGLMEPIDLILPTGLLNPDFSRAKQPAVVGGNTEVSQRLTDTLLKAFGLSACSQGTMNNFLFGNDHFGYYETICGGTGAGPGFRGTDAVHQHMTNTRITDPELLEFRYPVRLEKFEIRKGSGGKGHWNGGDGIVRELYFKEALEINLLTQHRKEKPYGLEGGGPGKTGEQFIIRKNARKERLSGMDSASVEAGDHLVILTPGGGSWGKRST